MMNGPPFHKSRLVSINKRRENTGQPCCQNFRDDFLGEIEEAD